MTKQKKSIGPSWLVFGTVDKIWTAITHLLRRHGQWAHVIVPPYSPNAGDFSTFALQDRVLVLASQPGAVGGVSLLHLPRVAIATAVGRGDDCSFERVLGIYHALAVRVGGSRM
jgi:hypothetical protein